MLKQGMLSIEKENIFQIIKENIYDEKDAFIREIISNSRDAIVKHQTLTGLTDQTGDYRIDIIIDEAANTIRFEDNGLGMDAEEIERYINNVAFSGAVDFVNQQLESSERNPIIGHFGLGFYSVFMVADHVTIDTLSWKEGAMPVHWSCVGSKMAFSMEDGTRQTRGTTVTIYLDSLEFTNAYRVFKSVCKYCSYLPTKIFVTVENETPKEGQKPFGTRPANYPVPVWMKDPNTLTDEDYCNCYHEVFGLIQDPVAWINLYNEDLGVKGVIWLRDLDASEGTLEGTIKLYSRQIFIADNVRELIPDFLMVQNGVIDIETLPLNVSRASIKDDGYARAVYAWIVEQVGEQIEAMYQNHREHYQDIWPVIGPFIKLGYLKNRKFRPYARRCMIYETSGGTFLSLQEYRDTFPPSLSPDVYYTSDLTQQAQYLTLFEQCGIPVLKMLHMVDQPFIRQLEMEDRELHFKRIDSDLFDILIEKEDVSEEEKQAEEQSLAEYFRTQTGQEKIQIRLVSLISDKVPSLMILDESTRRMQDTLELYGLAQGVDLTQHHFKEEVLILNRKNRLVQRILQEPDSQMSEILTKQIYDLARLGQSGLDDIEMQNFVKRSTDIMELWEQSNLRGGKKVE